MLRLKQAPLTRRLSPYGYKRCSSSPHNPTTKRQSALCDWGCHARDGLHRRPDMVLFSSSSHPQTTTSNSTGSSASASSLENRATPTSTATISQEFDVIASTARELHERRVAEAHAAILQKQESLRRNKQNQHSPPPPPQQQQQLQQQQQQEQQILQDNQQKKQKAVRRHILVNSILHWLSKDISFFESTMSKLSINSNWMMMVHDNDNIDNQQQQQLHPKDPNHPNNDHAIWNQYRHLYYDSIGSFRNEIERNPPLSLQEILNELEDTNFANAKWSKLYRKERGKSNLQQHIIQLQEELQQEEIKLQELQKELDELQQQQLLERQKQKDKQIQNQSLLPPRQQHMSTTEVNQLPKQREDSSSLFSQVWEVVTSFLGPTTTDSSSASSSSDSNNKKENEWKSSLPQKTPRSVLPFHEGRSRYDFILQRQIKRKQDKINDEEYNVKLTREKVQRWEESLIDENNSKSLSPGEYKEARERIATVRDAICHELARFIQERHEQLITQYQTLDAKTDLTKPHEWYSYARLDRRKIIFHGGPTNSGKTYTALQRLMEAEKGLYLAPLRLLAAEVYDTLTAEGIYTNLFTGQERREVAFSTHAAATVEMANVQIEYDVVVMDEIQMIGDATRGAAWTRALLGLRSKEIHVCGGNEAKEIVRKIAQSCGDTFEVHSYERFSPLEVMDYSLARKPKEPGCYKHVQPGDCVVAFSRKDIFAIKREIESTTNHKCCVIYGKLPPQTRTDQARRFNDPNSGYDVLVASDAIGMGLNLNIRRIIFNSIFKFDGQSVIRLDHSSVKQIAGRAGRRNSPYPNGQVTCRDPRDLDYIRDSMTNEIETLEKAGILPTAAHIQLFSDALQIHSLDIKDDDEMNKRTNNNKRNTIDQQSQPQYSDLDRVLRQFSAMATVKGYYFLCRQTEMKMVAKRLKGIALPIRDAYTMCLSPTSESSLQLLGNFARKLSCGEVPGMPSNRVPKKAKNFDDLGYLCSVYGDADLFLWLQYKFPPTNAVEHQAALARKEQSIAYINDALANTEALKLDHCYIRQAERHRSLWQAESSTSDSTDGPGFNDSYGKDDVEYDDEYDDVNDEEAMY